MVVCSLPVGLTAGVTVWDLATGRECRRFIGHTRSVPGDVYYGVVNPAPVPAVAFTPKGDRVVSGCFDGTALVWDTAGLATALTDQKEIVELCALLVGSDTAAAHRASFALAARASKPFRCWFLVSRLRCPLRPARTLIGGLPNWAITRAMRSAPKSKPYSSRAARRFYRR